MTESNDSKSPWLTAMVEYEGQPLALRVRPAADTPANRARFPHLAVVSHELSVVTATGLSEADYHESPADFDHDVHTYLEGNGDGIVVLVETLSGKRNYWAHVRDNL